MKYVKAAIALLMALITSAGILTGCSEQYNASSTSGVQQDNISLKWYFMGNFPQPEQERIFEEVNKMLLDKIGVTCEFMAMSWGDFESKMSRVISSGEEFDVCYTSNFTNNYYQNVAKGSFVPLDDLLETYAPKTFASIDSEYWDAVRINGKIYGVINQQVFANTPTVQIPKELAEKYELDLNSSLNGNFANLTPFLEKVHKDQPELAVRIGGIYTSYDCLGGTDIPGAIKRDDKTLTVFNQFESEEYLSAVNTIREWNEKGYTHGEEYLMSQPTSIPGKLIWSAEIDGCYKPSNTTVDANGISVVNIPFGKPLLGTPNITGTMQAISITSQHPEKAMEMLEIFNTDQDAYMLLNYGMKGEHWDTDEEGFLVNNLEKSKNYSPTVNWMFATNFMQIPFAHEGSGIWERTKQYNNDAQRSPAFGFSFNAEPVKNEISKCSVVIDTYEPGLKLGVYTEEEVQQMQAELKKAGVDQIIEEMQKQVDQWAKSQEKK